MQREPEDPQARAVWRRARWNAARLHHPDLGGDPDVYVRKMREIDHRFGAGRASATVTGLPTVGPSRLAIRVRRAMRRGRRRVRQRGRRVRGALPRRFPGSRRYLDL